LSHTVKVEQARSKSGFNPKAIFTRNLFIFSDVLEINISRMKRAMRITSQTGGSASWRIGEFHLTIKKQITSR
jgi:hypothetical protein